jgi:cytochrome c oxidase subunit 3
MLWLSTLILAGSGFTFRRAQRFLRDENHADYRRWLFVTLGLGVAFVWAQMASWAQLAAQGVYLQGSPHSSFFYLFTGLHGVHVLGGLTALAWLAWQAKRVPDTDYALAKRQALVGAAELYWRFMGGLWVCLFALLLLWK